jgi:thiol-disulfide isomerase/thioredoxin/uncharacterized membrane protein YphA (DoxX/SURF4 family)
MSNQNSALSSSATSERGRYFRLFSKMFLFLLGVVFLASGLAKVRQFDLFLDLLDSYMIVPEDLVHAAGLILVSLELTVAIGLLLPIFQSRAAIAAAGLLVLFALAMSASLFNHMSINCGCMAPLSGPANKINWWLVGRNTALALCCIVAGPAVSREGFWWRTTTLWSWPRRIVSAVFAMGMIGFNLGLIQKNQSLADRIEALQNSISHLQNPRKGQKIDSFYAALAGRSPELIDFAHSRMTWLLIFSPTCPHCQQIMPAWHQLAADLNAAKDTTTKIVGISVDPNVTSQFIATYDVNFPVYVPTDTRKLVKQLNVWTLPKAVLLDSTGTILKSF